MKTHYYCSTIRTERAHLEKNKMKGMNKHRNNSNCTDCIPSASRSSAHEYPASALIEEVLEGGKEASSSAMK